MRRHRREGGLETRRTLVTAMAAAGLLLAACGESPLGALGERSSSWINEPEVVTTTTVVKEVPLVVPSTALSWSNEGIGPPSSEEPGEVISAVFSRRQGDRFIQASRQEIAAAIPGIMFPASVPFGAEWVSSQLVVENDGTLADDVSAAFGIWSAEPYTRSRSVAQMAIIRVAHDPAGAELAAAESPGCAAFADRSVAECTIATIGGREMWELIGSGGTTLIYYDGPLRYEVFARNFVARPALEQMASAAAPLSELAPAATS